jgi:hypothetical protein
LFLLKELASSIELGVVLSGLTTLGVVLSGLTTLGVVLSGLTTLGASLERGLTLLMFSVQS